MNPKNYPENIIIPEKPFFFMEIWPYLSNNDPIYALNYITISTKAPFYIFTRDYSDLFRVNIPLNRVNLYFAKNWFVIEAMNQSYSMNLWPQSLLLVGILRCESVLLPADMKSGYDDERPGVIKAKGWKVQQRIPFSSSYTVNWNWNRFGMGVTTKGH